MTADIPRGTPPSLVRGVIEERNLAIAAIQRLLVEREGLRMERDKAETKGFERGLAAAAEAITGAIHEARRQRPIGSTAFSVAEDTAWLTGIDQAERIARDALRGLAGTGGVT